MKINLSTKNAFVILITLALTACSALQPATPHLSPLRVEYTLWWGDYTLLVAKEKGFFDKYGVQVDPTYYPVFSHAYSDLAAGQVDAALIPSGDVMNINRHAHTVIIGLSDDGGYMPFVARPEIKTVSNLKGKTVGTLIGSQYELLLMEMLASASLTAADVTIKNINPEQLSEKLAKNEIQAGFSWEPFTTTALKQGAHVLYPTDDKLRLFPDMIAFRQDVIDQRPQDIHNFMKAWFEAVEYRLAHTDETRQIAAKYIRVPVDQIQPDLSQKIYTYDDNIALYDQATGESSIYAIVQKTANYLITSGSLAVMPKIETILTQSFLPPSQESFRE